MPPLIDMFIVHGDGSKSVEGVNVLEAMTFLQCVIGTVDKRCIDMHHWAGSKSVEGVDV